MSALVKQETSLIELSFQDNEECSLHDNLQINTSVSITYLWVGGCVSSFFMAGFAVL
jgi:hypothetical protein